METIRTAAFVDIVGSTSLYQDRGNRIARQLVQTALDRCEAVAVECQGKVVKSIGDGLLLMFDRPDEAAMALIEMHQRSLVPLQDTVQVLQLRSGFSHGTVIESEGDFFGDVINLAARLCSFARPGQILSNAGTTSELDLALSQRTRSFDLAMLKGMASPVHVIEILWEAHAPTEIVHIVKQDQYECGILQLTYLGNVVAISSIQLPITVGRSPTCTIRVAGDRTSREHFKITHSRGKFVLIDQSSNGTFVRLASGNEQIVFVRNESFPLVGQGLIGLGRSPLEDTHCISFLIAS